MSACVKPAAALALATGATLAVLKQRRRASKPEQPLRNEGSEGTKTHNAVTGLAMDGEPAPTDIADARGRGTTMAQLARQQSYIWLTWLNDVIFTAMAVALVYLTCNAPTLVGVSAIGLARLTLLARERGLAATAAAKEETTQSTVVVERVPPEPASPAVADEPVALGISGETLNGVWRKDGKLSEPMDSAMELVRLNPLIRRAVGLVNGLELEITDSEFKMAVLCAIPWFKVREHYPLTGEPVRQKRRDLRRGHSVGSVKLREGQLLLSMSWEDPHAGSGLDTYRLVSSDTLHVHCAYDVGGRTASYTHVYHRRR